MPMQFVRIARKSLALSAVAAACATLLVAPAVHAQALKSYDSTKKEFWANPPPDWFLGDETEAQKGLAPPAGPALPTSDGGPAEEPEDDQAAARASRSRSTPAASRGAADGMGRQGHAVRRLVRRRQRLCGSPTRAASRKSRPILKGLKMPTGLAFRDGALYVADIDKILQVRQRRSQPRQDAGRRRSSTTTCRRTWRTAGST